MSILSNSRATGGNVWNPNTTKLKPLQPTPSHSKKLIAVQQAFVVIIILIVLSFIYLIVGAITIYIPQDFKEKTKDNVLTYTIPDLPPLPMWFDISVDVSNLENDWIKDKAGENGFKLVKENGVNNQRKPFLEKGITAWYDGKDSYYQIDKNVEGQKVTLTLTKMKNFTELNKAIVP
jgi:hypothetical protein